MKTNRTIAGWLTLLALSILNLQPATTFAQNTNWSNLVTNWTSTSAPGNKDWFAIASSADGTQLAAVIYPGSGGIYTSTNSGSTWTNMGSAAASGAWTAIASSSDGTKLAAAWYGVGDGCGIYTSTNSGVTWTNTGSAPAAYWQCIASSSDGTKLAAVSWTSGIWISTDSGATWTQASATGTHYYSVASSVDGNKLAAVAWNVGIYTSTNSGVNWTNTGSAPAIAWSSIASSADGTKLAAVADNGSGIWISTNSGNAWIQTSAPGTAGWYSVASSADGTKLAAVVYGGGIWTAQATISQQSQQTGNTWYVWQDSPANGPGTAWNNAFHDIQSAVNVATNGDTVLVTNGVYSTGGMVTPGGSLTNLVCITNVITLKSVNGPSVTTIIGSGLNLGLGLVGVRCVYMGTNGVMSGFTLTDGFANGPGTYDQLGGGVCCMNGGIITNCILTENFCSYFGAGVYGGTLYNCTLTGGFCDMGGGAWNSTLYNCLISGNSAVAGGGAWECILYNCTINNNSTYPGYAGGGAYACTLYNCTLSGNTADNGVGGGTYDCILYNCLISGNSASYAGGVSGGTLINCTVVSNTASSIGGGVSSYTPIGNGFSDAVILTNCIIYNNNAPSYPNYDTNCVLSYCCTVPLPPGSGNIASDPQFVNSGTGNYRLLAGSPCINAGNNAAVVGLTDLDGNPRIYGGIVDMGAYEFQGVPLGLPAITNTIASATLSSGGSVTLTAGVSGTPPFTYQWCCNGTPVAGATNAILTISNFCLADVGTYTVTVSNAAGSVTSPPALLASVGIGMFSTFAGVIVNGPLGSNYLIQARSDLSGGNWRTLTNVALPSQPYIYIDYNSPANPHQFYKAVPQ
jgi:hypothetical protein